MNVYKYICQKYNNEQLSIKQVAALLSKYNAVLVQYGCIAYQRTFVVQHGGKLHYYNFTY